MIIRFSTRQAARELGIGESTLANYLEAGKIPKPESVIPGKRPTYVWTEKEVERARELLPKIANGRKTRYKKHSALSNQQSAKASKKHSALSNQQSAKAKSKNKGRSKKEK